MVGIQEQRLKLKPICVLDWPSQCYAAALRYVTGILTWAASKTSMKGFSIRVHVGNPPRKPNLHARKPRESSANCWMFPGAHPWIYNRACWTIHDARSRKECVKVEPRKQWRKQVDSRSTFKYTCAQSFTGNFPRKQPRKISRNTSPREPELCARKNRESRRESL